MNGNMNGDRWKTNRRTGQAFPMPEPYRDTTDMSIEDLRKIIEGQQGTAKFENPPFPPEPAPEPLFGNEPILGDDQPTQPVVEQYDPDKAAEEAGKYYDDAISNAGTKEELMGWKTDIDSDARLSFGEKARYKKKIDDQIVLLEAGGLVGEEAEGFKEQKKEKKKEETKEDNSLFGNEPIFPNPEPLFGEKDESDETDENDGGTLARRHTTHSMRRKTKKRHKGLFQDAKPLF